MSDVPQQPPQPATEPNFAPYTGPSLETVKSIVASQFQVKDAFLDPYGIPTILVSAEPTREKFRTVAEQLRTQNLLGAIRATGDTLTIKVFQKPQIKPSRRTINLGLFLATVVTVTRSEEHTSELQSHSDLVCRLLLEKKKATRNPVPHHSLPM